MQFVRNLLSPLPALTRPQPKDEASRRLGHLRDVHTRVHFNNIAKRDIISVGRDIAQRIPLRCPVSPEGLHKPMLFGVEMQCNAAIGIPNGFFVYDKQRLSHGWGWPSSQ